MTLDEAIKKNWQLLFRDKTTGMYFILGDSDNYGYDCYSFNADKEQQDGYIPFAVDICDTGHGLSEKEVEEEEALISKWTEEMSDEQRVDYCLKAMGSSLENCEILDDEELLEELWEKC